MASQEKYFGPGGIETRKYQGEEYSVNPSPLFNNGHRYLVNLPIEELDLSTRPYTRLRKGANATLVGQVLRMEEVDLMSIKGFGRKSLDEVINTLRVLGLLGKTKSEKPQ